MKQRLGVVLRHIWSFAFMVSAIGGAHAQQWVASGTTDCPGQDVYCSAGVSPDPARCNSSTLGQTAVCWQARPTGFPNTPGNCHGQLSWCTYKAVSVDQCVGGGAPGNAYACTAAGRWERRRQSQSNDIILFAKRMNRINHPTILSTINSNEFKNIAKAIAVYYGISPQSVDQGVAFVNGAARATVNYDVTAGTTHRGLISSPPGYTICRADWINPSLNCNNTFNASIRRGRLDGLHMYMVVNQPRQSWSGRCWIDGYIAITFVRPSERSRYNCTPYGHCAWLEGPGGRGRNLPCGVPPDAN